MMGILNDFLVFKEQNTFEPRQILCLRCGSSDIIQKGARIDNHRFQCKSCGKYFTDSLGFEGRRSAPEYITVDVELVYVGLSIRKTVKVLHSIYCNVGRFTIHRWADQYGHMINEYLDGITPLVGEEWRTDEIYMKIRGKRKYLFAMLDSETRYWIAKQVATHKGTDDVRPMFKQARDITGKIPSKLISDGASNFAETHKDE